MSENVYDFEKEARKRYVRERARKWILFGGIVLVALILLTQSLFVVGEAEQAVVSRFGVIRKIVLNSDNTFHSDYAELLKDEITLGGSIKTETGGGAALQAALCGQGGKVPFPHVYLYQRQRGRQYR